MFYDINMNYNYKIFINYLNNPLIQFLHVLSYNLPRFALTA